MVEGAISEGPRDVNRGQRSRMRRAGQTHLAWTQVLWSLFVQGRRMDPRILFVRNSGRGQLQKPPRSSLDRRAFLAPGKGYRKGARARARGGRIFFYILDPGRSFFYEPFFPRYGLSQGARGRSSPPSPLLFATHRGPFAQLSSLSLLVASPSAPFSRWPRERIALDLLRLRS